MYIYMSIFLTAGCRAAGRCEFLSHWLSELHGWDPCLIRGLRFNSLNKQRTDISWHRYSEMGGTRKNFQRLHGGLSLLLRLLLLLLQARRRF
jgi:hypothetical protein